MKLISPTLKKSLIAIMVAVQTFGYSAITFSRIAVADETTAATSEAVVPPACPSVNGTTAPTGAASATFVFDPATCTWENAYYSWSPATKEYTPKYSQTPIYNPDNNCWEHIVWEYVSSDGQYEARTVSVPAASTATGGGASALPSDISGGSDGGSLAQSTGSSTISSGNGTGSNNTLLNNNNTNVNANLLNNTSVLTALGSNATSGDASALFNTTVGDVGTGDAATIANILNMIQSSWNPTNGNLNLFSADLYNNYFGDLLFNPSIALGNGTSSANNIANDSNQNLTINSTDNANIENNINLAAQSGSADASGNTTVGDVSTGDASAIANVLNMINSMITSGQSFLGSINLYGDLNGDILLPQSIMDILLGNGTGSSNTIANNQSTNVNADSTSNSTITNNTDLTASSGLAVADANTTVGNLTTGTASTNVNEMNLVGQNIQGTKGLLVFVNVLGSWIGMLFGSPVTSSIAGGNGTNSTNNIANNTATNADINTASNYGIVNNLNLNAASGNATANANTTVGNVSTGNASAGVNLLNMINSSMNFTDWFGVLFINVFGSWNGSFGVNTAAGNAPAASSSSATTATGAAAGQGGGSNTFSFMPHVTANSQVFGATYTGGQDGGGQGQSGPQVAGSTSSNSVPPTSSAANSSTAQDDAHTAATTSPHRRLTGLWIPGAGLLAGAVWLGAERLFVLVQQRRRLV